jgi:hypothetical protein
MMGAVTPGRCSSQVQPLPGPHHQFAVQHTLDGDLSGQFVLDVGELRGEVLAVSRPQPHLAASAHCAGAEAVPLQLVSRSARHAVWPWQLFDCLGEFESDGPCESGRNVAHGISVHHSRCCVCLSAGLGVEPCECSVLDGVVGRAEWWGIGEVQLGDVVNGAAVEDSGGEDVDAFGDLGWQVADELGAEEFAGGGVAGDALGDGCGAGVVDLVVVGLSWGCERPVSGGCGFFVAESGGRGDEVEDPYDLGSERSGVRGGATGIRQKQATGLIIGR